jgi:hypothetical protein
MMALHPEAPEQRVTTLGSLGLTQWLAGDNEAALASFEDAIVQLQAIPTPPPDLATIVWRDRCVLLLAQDDPLAAAEACEHADRNRTGADLVPDDRARLERAHVWLDLLQGASPDSLSWPVPEQRDETDAHVDEAFDRALATRRRPTARPGS